MAELLTPSEAAAHPRYHRLGNARWFRDRLKEGALTGSRVRGRWYLNADAIEALLASASNSTTAPTTRRRRKRRIT